MREIGLTESAAAPDAVQNPCIIPANASPAVHTSPPIRARSPYFADARRARGGGWRQAMPLPSLLLSASNKETHP